jgi:hypothetical protein
VYAVIIMAKAPIATEVKTRLVPPLDSQTASDLYRSFLLDKIEQVKTMNGVHPFVAYTPQTSDSLFSSIIPLGFTLIPQVGADLGERLLHVSNSLFNRGFRKVVLSDSDTPNLPIKIMKDAIDRLDSFDVVLGPCEDGGYYLIGLRSNMPELFREIPWGTSEVAKLTMKKAMKMHATISLLDEWYDVDTVEMLLRLKRDLYAKPPIGFFGINSYQVLSKIDLEKLSRQMP